jgi:hypothetical protein
VFYSIQNTQNINYTKCKMVPNTGESEVAYAQIMHYKNNSFGNPWLKHNLFAISYSQTDWMWLECDNTLSCHDCCHVHELHDNVK